MILWILTVAILSAEGDLDGISLRDYETFQECAVAADKLREKIRIERPAEVPADAQVICWPEPKETSKPKAKLMKGV